MEQELIKKIIDSTLSFNEYFCLKIIQNNAIYHYNKFEQKFRNNIEDLIISQYLFIDNGYKLTKKAEFQLKLIDCSVKIEEKVEKDNKYERLYLSLQKHLQRWQNKKQIRGFGGVYFMPTLVELEEFLLRFWKKYPKYTDMSKIEKILCKHIEDCYRKGQYSPAIKYFIGKTTNDGFVSQLANAYEEFKESDSREIKIGGDFVI